MNKSTTLAIILATGLAGAPHAVAGPPEWEGAEKCYGVSPKGQNDCGSFDGSHQCSGFATRDNDDNEWIYVPQGLCEKITGGFTREEKKES